MRVSTYLFTKLFKILRATFLVYIRGLTHTYLFHYINELKKEVFVSKEAFKIISVVLQSPYSAADTFLSYECRLNGIFESAEGIKIQFIMLSEPKEGRHTHYKRDIYYFVIVE